MADAAKLKQIAEGTDKVAELFSDRVWDATFTSGAEGVPHEVEQLVRDADSALDTLSTTAHELWEEADDA